MYNTTTALFKKQRIVCIIAFIELNSLQKTEGLNILQLLQVTRNGWNLWKMKRILNYPQ